MGEWGWPTAWWDSQSAALSLVGAPGKLSSFLCWPLCPGTTSVSSLGAQGVLALLAQRVVGLVSTGEMPSLPSSLCLSVPSKFSSVCPLGRATGSSTSSHSPLPQGRSPVDNWGYH